MIASHPEGERFGQYVVGELIGAGGVSEVYAARHAFTGVSSALKVLQMRHVGNARLTELAKAEALALSRIRHQNLVPVTDAGITEGGVVWMVMPRLDGWTLREHLARNRGTIPLGELLRIAIDVADGVCAAHEEGVVHRDVKPENVFVSRRGEIIVLDLGMAKFHDFGVKSTGGGKVMGTVRYMAPEQILGKSVDKRTDVYALGVLLWEMVAGEHPFHRSSDGELLTSYQVGMAHLSRPAPALSGCPPELAEVVASALHKDPAKRPPSMQDLARSLREIRRRVEAAAPQAGTKLEAGGGARGYVPPSPQAELDTPPTRPIDRVRAHRSTPTTARTGRVLDATRNMEDGMPLPDLHDAGRDAPTKVSKGKGTGASVLVGVVVGTIVAAGLQVLLHGLRFP